jgi:hypothetical protein
MTGSPSVSRLARLRTDALLAVWLTDGSSAPAMFAASANSSTAVARRHRARRSHNA